MKVTIEEMQGKKYTLVTVGDVEEWELQEADKIIDWRGVYTYIQGKYTHPLPASAFVIGYALPALPQYLDEKNAYIFDLYRSFELYPMNGNDGYIPYARTKEGNRIEVAICEKS